MHTFWILRDHAGFLWLYSDNPMFHLLVCKGWSPRLLLTQNGSFWGFLEPFKPVKVKLTLSLHRKGCLWKMYLVRDYWSKKLKLCSSPPERGFLNWVSMDNSYILLPTDYPGFEHISINDEEPTTCYVNIKIIKDEQNT